MPENSPAPDPPSPSYSRALTTAVGGGLGILAMIGLATLAGLALGAVPFTTSIVLVMAAPEAPQAQPRNIVGGHLLCALAGLAVVSAFGMHDWAAGLAVA